MYRKTVSRVYSKILLPLDGSERSGALAKKGIEIAKRFGSSVVVASIIDTKTFFGRMGTADPLRMEKAWDELKVKTGIDTERMVNEIKAFAEEEEIPVEKVIIEGKPEIEIVKIARQKGVDLIVMGSNRITNKFILGSVAETVVRNASCSVMIIR